MDDDRKDCKFGNGMVATEKLLKQPEVAEREVGRACEITKYSTMKDETNECMSVVMKLDLVRRARMV